MYASHANKLCSIDRVRGGALGQQEAFALLQPEGRNRGGVKRLPNRHANEEAAGVAGADGRNDHARGQQLKPLKLGVREQIAGYLSDPADASAITEGCCGIDH